MTSGERGAIEFYIFIDLFPRCPDFSKKTNPRYNMALNNIKQAQAVTVSLQELLDGQSIIPNFFSPLLLLLSSE